jgi:hypothetical protein
VRLRELVPIGTWGGSVSLIARDADCPPWEPEELAELAEPEVLAEPEDVEKNDGAGIPT